MSAKRAGFAFAALVAALVAMLVATSGCARGGGGAHDAVRVEGAWSRTSPAGARAGVLYLTLTSERADQLLSITVPPEVAARAELHGVYHDATGQLAMRALEHVDLPARGPVAFYPGSMHIMLMELAKPLAAGTSYDATLHFRDAGEQVVHVPVRDEQP